MPKRTTGRYESVTAGDEKVDAFVPFDLPPVRPTLVIDTKLERRLGQAEQALIRLDLAGEMVPSLDWFIYAFVRKEAVISSQIEGTQASLVDLVAKQAATQDELNQNQAALADARANLQALEQKTAALKQQTGVDAEAADLRVKQAQGQVQSLEEKLRSATVTAEVDGTLYSLPVHAGDYVKVGDILAEMADLRQVRVRAFVDEPDLGSLAPDEDVRVNWDAMPNRTWTGKVEQVPKQVVARGTRSVGEVLCSVQNDKVELLPNVNVEVHILVRQRPGVLVVARRAVSYENGQHFVFVFDGEKVHRRQFEAGIASDKSYEVVSGLALGDKIALPGDVDLKDGMEVRATEAK